MLRSRLRPGKLGLVDDEFFYFLGLGIRERKGWKCPTKVFVCSKGIHCSGAVVPVDLIEPGDAAGEVFGTGVPIFSLTPIECICQFHSAN